MEAPWLNMQWKRPGSTPPKKFRTQPSASNVMATVFWDSKGIILINYTKGKRKAQGVPQSQTAALP